MSDLVFQLTQIVRFIEGADSKTLDWYIIAIIIGSLPTAIIIMQDWLDVIWQSQMMQINIKDLGLMLILRINVTVHCRFLLCTIMVDTI